MAEKVLVLHPVLTAFSKDRKEGKATRIPEAALEEAVGLARAIDLDVVHSEIVNIKSITPATLIGSGVVERTKKHAEELDAKLVYVDYPLSPVQQRNLEKGLNCKVIDRTGLILEIFGARARTKEGQLQVDLAALTFQRSRLVKSWTHLERQRGGAGFLGGPGETQIEIDRRLIDEKIRRLKKELEDVKKNRRLQRESRKREPYPIIAIVGYTNAGKSTLFNKITGAKVFAKDLLFATLDTTMRGIELPSGKKSILSDTVGFISDLPTHLIAAFRATLEEVEDASVILHVRDISAENTEAEKEDVISILGDLGIAYATDERVIEVLNKVDALDPREEKRLLARNKKDPKVISVSALTGEGIDDLLAAIDARLGKERQTISVTIPLSDGKASAWLYRRGEVVSRKDREEGSLLKVHLEPADVERFKAQFPYKIRSARS